MAFGWLCSIHCINKFKDAGQQLPFGFDVSLKVAISNMNKWKKAFEPYSDDFEWKYLAKVSIVHENEREE